MSNRTELPKLVGSTKVKDTTSSGPLSVHHQHGNTSPSASLRLSSISPLSPSESDPLCNDTVMYDIIDLYSHQFLLTASTSLHKVLKNLLNHIEHIDEYGSLSCRIYLVRCMESICLRPPLYNGIEKKSLSDMSPKFFTRMLNDVFHVSKTLFKDNAVHFVRPTFRSNASTHIGCQNGNYSTSGDENEKNKDEKYLTGINGNSDYDKDFGNKQNRDGNDYNIDDEWLVDDAINQSFGNEGKSFQTQFDAMIIRFHVHHALGYIRCYIQQARIKDHDTVNEDNTNYGNNNCNENESTESPINVPRDALKNYTRLVNGDHFNQHNEIRSILLQMLHKEKKNDDKVKDSDSFLKPLSFIDTIFTKHANYLSHEIFQKDVQKLLMGWYEAAKLPEPRLIQYGYGVLDHTEDYLTRRGIGDNGYTTRAYRKSENMNTDDSSTDGRNINGMDGNNTDNSDGNLATDKSDNNGRRNSKKRPLSRTSGFYRKKKSAVSLMFDSPCSIMDSNSGRIECDSDGDTCKHIKKKRRRFTDEEKNAIMNGVEKFGYQWSLIKTYYKDVLSSRTAINIKDCHRTLVKNGFVAKIASSDLSVSGVSSDDDDGKDEEQPASDLKSGSVDLKETREKIRRSSRISALEKARENLRKSGVDPLEESIVVANFVGEKRRGNYAHLEFQSKVNSTEENDGECVSSDERGGSNPVCTFTSRGSYDKDADSGSSDEDKYVNNSKTKDNMNFYSKSNGDAKLETDKDSYVEPERGTDNDSYVDPERNTDNDSYVKSERKLPRKRRVKFTDEEKQAIIKGVKRFGTQWTLILKEYKTILRSRTGVNIKDCYRNLTKHQQNGEV